MNQPTGTTSPRAKPTSRTVIAVERKEEMPSAAVASQIEAAERRVAALLPPGHEPVISGEALSGAPLRDFAVALELVGVVADQLQVDNEELAAVLKRAEADLRHYPDLFLL